ncbi:MAG TPA: glutathione transferase GstA [Steroidobacteraceae bacterium]|nr:glutathione transferase GstA [Steroidobacteraceae bacterium]
MKLYYLKGACSLASNIALREAGVPFELVQVERGTKRAEGVDFNTINSKGYVPTLKLDDGEVLTENVAVLQYIGDRNPAAKLVPAAGTLERYRLQEWLAFINSEIHKRFSPIFAPDAKEDAKTFAREHLAKRLKWLNDALGNKKFLMGEQFTVADAYLFTVLTWAPIVHVDLAPFPALRSFAERVAARPHVKEAMKAEGLIKG